MSTIVLDSGLLVIVAHPERMARVMALPHEFLTPDVVLADPRLELSGRADELLALGLVGESFPPDELRTAARFQSAHPGLGLGDALAVLLAWRECALLLSDEYNVQSVTTTENVAQASSLWLFAELERHARADEVAQRTTAPDERA